ncbi:UDP-N-acetylmuramoyl-L-alanyl-D-glutamate--2,6-diaminopimelate ligase [Fervidibacillus albus]|uniref:UDP-N-acetylmuramoyl-L-alanyl-D-glutamate--2,6-diaminopimelate ligase n=1 Tax=Fervidibacillus albus TaxID=2980026 RepID=A0A9E8RWV4_9BACI|nr:UDP-N-acetylmuramoyl-L-alanyl-D-glutamate--2,6-diaminopimelate ligase [Fervidibacillus albus]WAA08837.1 UDP-N-acetylmuramoyl-L-alanyl-D-glutamate--2,6-diaminopimelate ligase [Fervidibacillus albus]
MKLREIADLFLVKETTGNLDIEITGIQMDSRKIQPGNLFVCVPGIKGFLEDRHLFVDDAIKNGAVALVLERDVDVDVPKIFVKDARHALAVIATHFYNYPSHEMKLIGITGTNGKTTTSYIIERILNDYGLKTGVMGNNGVLIDQKVYPTDINTQEPPILQHNLRKMRDLNTEYCVMEVSSQGLDMKRVLGVNFKTAIFTNLTIDHLDYHGNFEEYRFIKGLLFTRLGNADNSLDKKYVILNADDPNSSYFQKVTTAEVITYGINNTADVSAQNIRVTPKGIQFLLKSFKGDIDIEMQLIGCFNVYNALAGITAAIIEDVPLQNIKSSLSKIKSVRGRMEVVDEGQDYLVLIDYAHTPDALENVLKTVKEFSKGKIITVFGCGGDRDKTKRPIMGEIASKYSDMVIVTSDNPRSENPVKIIKEIESGIIKSSLIEYELIVDREDAITKAINMASSNDVVIIAGKGHETYQILKDKTIHFDDREVARKVIVKKA